MSTVTLQEAARRIAIAREGLVRAAAALQEPHLGENLGVALCEIGLALHHVTVADCDERGLRFVERFLEEQRRRHAERGEVTFAPRRRPGRPRKKSGGGGD